MSMQRYVVVKGFSLGGTEVTLREGDEVNYDGNIQIEVDGETFKSPKFRGAIKMGWVVLGELFDSGDMDAPVATRAPMKMRSAEGGNPMDYRQEERRDIRHSSVENDDRQVRSVSGHAQATKQWNNGRGQRTARAPMPISVDEQDARVVVEGAFQTPSVSRNNIEHGIGREQAEINALKIQPGKGISREQMLARMTPEEQEEYLSRIESHRSSHVDDAPAPTRVRKANTLNTEGIRVRTQVTGGTEIVDLGGGTYQAPATEVVEIEGIKITNTNGPKRDLPRKAAPKTQLVPTQKAVLADQDVRRRIAKSVCPDFPDLYDFNATDKKKIARIQADFDDRPDVIQAIYAAEGDAMKSLLVETFAEVFA